MAGEDSAPDVGVDVDALAARVEELAAMLTAMQEQMAASVQAMDEPAEEKEEEEASAELSDRDRRITALEAQLADRDAEARIAEVAAKRVLGDDSRAAMKSVLLADLGNETFDRIVAALPERPAAGPRIAGPGLDRSVSLSDQAHALRKAENITFSEAMKRLKGGK